MRSLTESLRAVARRLRGDRSGTALDVDRDLDAARTGPHIDVNAVIGDLALVVDGVPSRNRAEWRPMTRVVVMNATPRRIEWLREVAPAVRLVGAITEAHAIDALRDADALVGWCTPAMLDAAPRLRWFQSAIAGIDHLARVPALAERGVLVTNLRGVAAPTVAEHAIALLLGVTRGLAVPARDSHAHARALATLEGRTALVTGLGSVGARVVRLSNAIGMRVIGVRSARGAPPPGVDMIGPLSDLTRLAREAHAVINTLPLTPATRNVFDGAVFSTMPRGSYFVNVGRGGSVVTGDLVQALARGHLAGAGLDVVDPEPLPRRHPLRAMPNVLLTAHTAGASDDAYRLEWMVMRENLRRYAAGEALIGVVDLSRGY